MASARAPSVGARIVSLRCDPALFVARHARGHTGAEYLADVASAAGPDSAMAARELSACLFELFELVRRRPPKDALQLVLEAHLDAVHIECHLPGEGLDDWLAWSAPIADDRDPLRDPDPGDGLRELVAVHGIGLDARAVDDGVRLSLRVPLRAAAGHGEAVDAG